MAKPKLPPKTILLFARDFGPVSPSGRMIYDVVRILLKEGHKVFVQARKFAPRLPADPNLKVARTRFRFPGPLTVMRAVKKINADVVMSCADQQPVFSLAAKVAQAKNISHVALVWSLENTLRPDSDSIVRTRFIVSGRCIASRLIASGFEAKQMSVISPWLDRGYFRPDTTDTEHQALKAEKDIRTDDTPKFRVLFWGPEGSFTPYQGIVDLATILASTNPEIEFLFVGDGKAHEKIAHIRSSRTLDNIRLVPTPPASKFKALMQSGDVHIVTLAPVALGHNVPLGVFAAVMAERPVVFVGPTESEAAIIIRDFKCGEVIAPFQAGALQDALMLYRHNADAWYAAGKASAGAAKSFSPEQSLKATIQRLYDVLT